MHTLSKHITAVTEIWKWHEAFYFNLKDKFHLFTTKAYNETLSVKITYRRKEIYLKQIPKCCKR